MCWHTRCIMPPRSLHPTAREKASGTAEPTQGPMKIRNLVRLAPIGALALIACATSPVPDEAPTGTVASDLYMNSSWTWDTHRVPVCWEDTSPEFATQRAWVQDTMTNAWQWY